MNNNISKQFLTLNNRGVFLFKNVLIANFSVSNLDNSQDDMKTVGKQFIADALAGASIEEAKAELLDLADLNNVNSTFVASLVDSVAAAISLLSSSPSKTQESNIRGQLAESLLIALDFANSQPDFQNDTFLVSFLTAQDNNELFELSRSLFMDLVHVFENPSLGFSLVNDNATINRMTQTVSLAGSSYTKIMDDSCKLKLIILHQKTSMKTIRQNID
jgi:hypothetical protein